MDPEVDVSDARADDGCGIVRSLRLLMILGGNDMDIHLVF